MTISQFSEMCQLPPQTLRFYHSERLVVPAEVDGQTGYRWYTFDQVEQALLVATLRRAGLSLRDVRSALDDGDTAPALLAEHTVKLHRRRREQDEALRDARTLTEDWPQVRRQHVAETVVVSTTCAGAAVTDHHVVPEHVVAAAHSLTTTATACGATVTGPAWLHYALDTRQQKQKAMTTDGPDWTVHVPIAADPAAGALPTAGTLPKGVTVSTLAAWDEVSLVMPGRETLPKLATALQRLTRHALDEEQVPDLGRPRHVLHVGAVEVALTICAWDAEPAPT